MDKFINTYYRLRFKLKKLLRIHMCCYWIDMNGRDMNEIIGEVTCISKKCGRTKYINKSLKEFIHG